MGAGMSWFLTDAMPGEPMRVYAGQPVPAERWEQTYTTTITVEPDDGKHRFVLFDRGNCADFKRVRVLPVVR